jgi:hypothetical protein
LSVDSNVYGKILALRFVSQDQPVSVRNLEGGGCEDSYYCFIACERLHKRQVSMFNICDHKSYHDSQVSKNYLNEIFTINFNYQCDLTENLKIEIAPNFKQFILVDRDEKLLIEMKNGYYSQTNLSHLKGKVCLFVINSPETKQGVNGGFYIIVSNEYS